MHNTKWEYDGGDFNNAYSYDPISRQIMVRYSQPVDAIIRNNKQRRSTEDNSARRRRGDLYQIAEIPVGIIHMWKVKHGVDINDPDHWPDVMRLIQSSDYNSTVAVADGNFLKAPVRTHFVGARDSSSHPLGSNRASSSIGAGGLIRGGVF